MNARQEVLFAIGVMGLKPYEQSSAYAGSARHSYERLIDMAIKRGVDRKVRRQLLGAARRGVATPFAMGLIAAVCATLEQDEIDAELRALARFNNAPFSAFFAQGGAA